MRNPERHLTNNLERTVSDPANMKADVRADAVREDDKLAPLVVALVGCMQRDLLEAYGFVRRHTQPLNF